MGTDRSEVATKVRRQHFCHLCPCKYTTKHNLQEHIRIKHQGACPFRCLYSLCLRSFSYKHHLKRHIKTVHEKSTKQVCRCGREFSRASSYERHLNSRIGESCLRSASPASMGSVKSPFSVRHTSSPGAILPGQNLARLSRASSNACSDSTSSSASSTSTKTSTAKHRDDRSSSSSCIMSIDNIINPVQSHSPTSTTSGTLFEKYVNDEDNVTKTISDRVEALAHKIRAERYNPEIWGHERFDRLRLAIDLLDKLL